MATNQFKLPKAVKAMMALMPRQSARAVYKQLMMDAEISNQLARTRRVNDNDSDRKTSD
jgi:hypothetical protein